MQYTIAPVVAEFDAEAPADLHNPRKRYDHLREPDFFDPVTGESVWLNDDGVVTVPLEHLNTFRAYMACGGLSTSGRGTFKVSMTNDQSWSHLKRLVETTR